MTGPAPAGALVLMVGAQGSGKSSLVAEHAAEHARFSLDMFRLLLAGDVDAQQATPAAVDMLDTVIRYRMAEGLFTVVDSTHARPEHRDRLRRVAERHGRPTIAVLMHTPLQTCLDRQQRRRAPYAGANDRPVPARFVARAWSAIAANPPTAAEFDIVIHYRPAHTPRLAAETRHPLAYARQLLAGHQFMADVPAVRAGGIPWLANV